MSKYEEGLKKWSKTSSYIDSIDLDDPAHQGLDPEDELPINQPEVEKVIQMLDSINCDGETMEYIIRKLGLEDQMLKQLSKSED